MKECFRNHDFYSEEEKAFLVLTNQEERERLNWIIMCQESSNIKHFLAYHLLILNKWAKRPRRLNEEIKEDKFLFMGVRPRSKLAKLILRAQ